MEKELLAVAKDMKQLYCSFLIDGFKEKTSRFYGKEMAMYKTRNTGTGNRMRGTRGIGECYIQGNIPKQSGECPQTFRGILPNIPGNVLEKSREYSKIIWDMLLNILWKV